MNLTQDRKWTTLLFNPFVYIAGAQALGLGLAAILLAGLIGAIGTTHFDGVLDTHVGRSAPLGVFIGEGLIDWLCLAVVLLVFGKLVSKTNFRTIDLVGTQALARWPTLITALVTLPPAVGRFSRELLQHVANPAAMMQLMATPDAIIFFGATLIMLPLLVWTIALMYQSYSVSCNIRGAKAIVTFIIGLQVEVRLQFALKRFAGHILGLKMPPKPFLA
jgi:hypothetical protein